MTEPYSFSQYKPFESKALKLYDSDPTEDLFKTNFGYQADDAANYSSDFKINSDDFTAFKNIPNFSAIGGTPTPYQATWFDKAFGYTDPITNKSFGGYAAPVASLLQAGFGFVQGNNQLKLNKEALAASKEQFSKQYETQKHLTNLDIMDHAKARYDMNPNRNPTPEEYYEKNKLV